jgi:hypothetical protein
MAEVYNTPKKMKRAGKTRQDNQRKGQAGYDLTARDNATPIYFVYSILRLHTVTV